MLLGWIKEQIVVHLLSPLVVVFLVEIARSNNWLGSIRKVVKEVLVVFVQVKLLVRLLCHPLFFKQGTFPSDLLFQFIFAILLFRHIFIDLNFVGVVFDWGIACDEAIRFVTAREISSFNIDQVIFLIVSVLAAACEHLIVLLFQVKFLLGRPHGA